MRLCNTSGAGTCKTEQIGKLAAEQVSGMLRTHDGSMPLGKMLGMGSHADTPLLGPLKYQYESN